MRTVASYSSTIEGKGEEKGEKERQVKLKSEEEVEKDRHNRHHIV